VAVGMVPTFIPFSLPLNGRNNNKKEHETKTFNTSNIATPFTLVSCLTYYSSTLNMEAT
jgi:hypothetical protein